MAIQIKKAVRERVFLKLVITGPSGGGKTLGAIGVAKGLAPTGKIGVIDSENRSASYYASRFDFDVIELEAPFTTQKYLEALRAFIDGGYEVVVIDSLTHEWAASGGILDQKSQKDARGGNSFTNWNEMKQLHNKFVETLLQSKIHVVCTLRSKMEYVMEEGANKKIEVKKIGLAPISSDGMEYEFGVMFDVERNSHLAIASKDRTGLFEGRSLNLDERVGRELADWLASGASLSPEPTTAPAPVTATHATASPAAPAASGDTQPSSAHAAQPVPQGAAKVAPTNAREKVHPTPASTGTSGKTLAAKVAPVAPTVEAPSDRVLAIAGEPPREWLDAMCELAAVTVGMPENTRKALVDGFDKEGPTSLPDLLAEIAKIKSVMEPTTPGEVFSQMERPAPPEVSQAASDFVDSIDPLPADTDEPNGGISQVQYEALNNFIGAFKINRDALRSWAFKSGHLLPGANGPTLARMKAEEFAKLRTKLCNQAIAAKGESWSQRTVRIINATPITTYQPMTAAS